MCLFFIDAENNARREFLRCDILLRPRIVAGIFTARRPRAIAERWPRALKSQDMQYLRFTRYKTGKA